MIITRQNYLDVIEMYKENPDSEGDPFNIAISKDVILDRKLVEEIFDTFKYSTITIASGQSQKTYQNVEALYSEEETKVLADNVNFIRQKYKKDILFDYMFTVEEAIKTSGIIEKIVNEINSAKVNGQPLSPLEKYLYAYSYVINRNYKLADENQDVDISRNLISITNGDKIVCVGFSYFLNALCNKLDIPCTTQSMTLKTPKGKYENHVHCIVRLDDPKYNLKGVYVANPTMDSLKSPTTYNFDNPFLNKGDKKFTFNGALITFDNLKNIYGSQFYLDKCVRDDYAWITDTDNQLVDMPTYISSLFPERIKNVTVDGIYGQAKQEIAAKKELLKQILADNMNSLTKDVAQEALKDSIREKVSVEKLLRILKHGIKFEDAINYFLDQLEPYGFSKQETLEIFKDTFNFQNLLNGVINQTIQDNVSVTKEQNEAILSTVTSIQNQFNQVPNMIEDLKPTDNVMSDEEAFEKLLNVFYCSFNKAMFNKDIKITTSEYIGLLYKRGYTQSQIADKLNEIVNSKTDEDLVQFYVGIHPDSQILRLKDNLAEYIYNGVNFYDVFEPAFNALKAEAIPATYDAYYSAFTNIAKAQGASDAEAKKFAQEILKATPLLQQNAKQPS